MSLHFCVSLDDPPSSASRNLFCFLCDWDRQECGGVDSCRVLFEAVLDPNRSTLQGRSSRMLDGENQRKLRNVLQELGTEGSWYATSVCEREYNEGAFLRMCQAVALSNAYDQAQDLGLLPVLGGSRTSRCCEEKSCSVRRLCVLRALGCAQKTAQMAKGHTAHTTTQQKSQEQWRGCSADERVQHEHEDDNESHQAASTRECPSCSEGLESAQTHAGAHDETPLRSTSGATGGKPTQESTSTSEASTQPRTRGLRIRGRRRKEEAST